MKPRLASLLALLAAIPAVGEEPPEFPSDEKNETPSPAEVRRSAVWPKGDSRMPAEKTGGPGDPSKRLPSLPGAPATAVEACESYRPGKLDPERKIVPREGPAKVSFAIEFDKLRSDWALMTVSRLPNEVVTLKIVSGEAESYRFDAPEGEFESIGPKHAAWRAPWEPGIYCLTIHETERDETMCLHVAVMRPWGGEEEFNGYQIGPYAEKPYRNNPRYTRPRGFIEVTPENRETWVSPRFQLKQFLCKQSGGYPKYLLLESRLLLKLELLIEHLEDEGLPTNGLYLMSAFRTPAYNAEIGNETSYSRHLYGDAADIFVDNNRDGRMDDLDFDGDSDDEDARTLFEKVRKLVDEPRHRFLRGGLGFYKAKPHRGPFIHVDTRGMRVQWGLEAAPEPKPEKPQ